MTFFSALVSAIMDGYPTFIASIIFIGLCTAVIGDVAGHLGCFIYLKDSVNAIAFVALGPSVPGNVFLVDHISNLNVEVDNGSSRFSGWLQELFLLSLMCIAYLINQFSWALYQLSKNCVCRLFVEDITKVTHYCLK